MAGDQQFCLRWNNHQSTLVSVFDSLLENSVLVDCTLAADGQQLKAHKVVLSACSPYLETLLSQHYDKHPILILKDVKYPELKAMLDYMYRGEVNISQDLLGSFLKAAESLQIKGLTDRGGSGEPPNKQLDSNRKQTLLNQPMTLTHVNTHSSSGNLSSLSHLEERKPIGNVIIPPHVSDSPSQSPLSHQGSVSPILRKRKKLNHVTKMDNPKLVKPLNDAGKVTNCQNDERTSQIAPTALGAIKSEPEFLPLSNKTEFKQNIENDGNEMEDTELVNDENNENVYQDDTTNTTTSPGPSHHFISQGFNEKSNLGGGSSEIMLPSSDDLQNSNQVNHKRFFDFKMENIMDYTDRLQSYMKGQGNRKLMGMENMMANADPLQSYSKEQSNCNCDQSFACSTCQKVYKSKSSLGLHIRLECGKEPKFRCPFCQKRCHQKGNLKVHMLSKHKEKMVLKF